MIIELPTEVLTTHENNKKTDNQWKDRKYK